MEFFGFIVSELNILEMKGWVVESFTREGKDKKTVRVVLTVKER